MLWFLKWILLKNQIYEDNLKQKRRKIQIIQGRIQKKNQESHLILCFDYFPWYKSVKTKNDCNIGKTFVASKTIQRSPILGISD